MPKCSRYSKDEIEWMKSILLKSTRETVKEFDLPISDEQIQEIVNKALKEVISSDA